MIRGVGQESALGKAAIEAALRSVQSNAQRVDQSALEIESLGAGGTSKVSTDFSKALENGLEAANKAARTGEQLPLDLLSGKVNDFHEVAAAIKQSEMVFRFSLEVRNKLIDAYRETMRMSV